MRWDDAVLAVQARSRAVAGIVDDDEVPDLVVTTDEPEASARKLLLGLVADGDMGDVAEGCAAVALQSFAVLSVCRNPDMVMRALHGLTAQTLALGLLLGRES